MNIQQHRAEAAEAKHDKAQARVRELKGALNLILPLAKGYAATNRVGSNLEYVALAEQALNSGGRSDG